MRGVLLLLFCVVAIVKSDTCVSFIPSLSQGTNCMGGVSCKYGLYCDAKAQCNPLVAIGGACDSTISGMCTTGTTCKGLKGSQTCIQNANPAQACNSSSVSVVPNCGLGLSCSFFTNLCTGGSLGDVCFNITDCGGNYNCTGGVCAATPNGNTCFGNTCLPASYCNINNICVPRVTAGSICSGTIPCAPGYYCIGISSTDQTVCVANSTRNPGEYCGAFDELCLGSRKCKNTFCAKNSPDDCSGSACAPFQVCTCNNLFSAGGYGKCINNPCDKAKTDVNNCLWGFCGLSGISNNQLTYPGSCSLTNCKDLISAYQTCSSAFKLVPSLFFVSILAIFISKFF